jgi:hypothetical protein
VAAWTEARWALRNGLSRERAREFLDWMDGWIAYHLQERYAMRGLEGMDMPAYYNKLEASAYQRASFAFLKLAATNGDRGALRGLSRAEAALFLMWLDGAVRTHRRLTAEFTRESRLDEADSNEVEAVTLTRAARALIAIARGTMEKR